MIMDYSEQRANLLALIIAMTSKTRLELSTWDCKKLSCHWWKEMMVIAIALFCHNKQCHITIYGWTLININM